MHVLRKIEKGSAAIRQIASAKEAYILLQSVDLKLTFFRDD
jgi:hypothetical protein